RPARPDRLAGADLPERQDEVEPEQKAEQREHAWVLRVAEQELVDGAAVPGADLGVAHARHVGGEGQEARDLPRGDAQRAHRIDEEARHTPQRRRHGEADARAAHLGDVGRAHEADAVRGRDAAQPFDLAERPARAAREHVRAPVDVKAALAIERARAADARVLLQGQDGQAGAGQERRRGRAADPGADADRVVRGARHRNPVYGSAVPDVRVSKRGAARIAAGHPWTFRADLVDPVPDGADEARVCDERGRPIASALIVPEPAPIALRTYARGPFRRVADDLPQRPARAIARRGGAAVCRLVHAEADELPGLFVDRYGDAAVVQAATG